MINLQDYCKIPRKSNPKKIDTAYRCYCDLCNKDRGYLSKRCANQLCKSCSGKISHSTVSAETRKKMSLAKRGKNPWNKGKQGVSSHTRQKMQTAKIGYIPPNKGIKTSTLTDDDRKQIRRDRSRHRYHTEINYRLRSVIRARLNQAINHNIKSGSAIHNLGCTIDELKTHLESQFQDQMTWDNWGRNGWHIDHIRPLSRFNLTCPEEIKKACHYTNLQPMWASQNCSKNNKISTVYLILGAPGAGKSWVCDQLIELYNYVSFDKEPRSQQISQLSMYTGKNKLFDPTIGISTFIKQYYDLFDLRLVIIREDIAILEQRIKNRGGKITPTICKRQKRILQFVNMAEFIGTSSEVLRYLKNI